MTISGIFEEQHGAQDIDRQRGQPSIASRLGLPSRYVKIFGLLIGDCPVMILMAMVFDMTVKETYEQPPSWLKSLDDDIKPPRLNTTLRCTHSTTCCPSTRQKDRTYTLSSRLRSQIQVYTNQYSWQPSSDTRVLSSLIGTRPSMIPRLSRMALTWPRSKVC